MNVTITPDGDISSSFKSDLIYQITYMVYEGFQEVNSFLGGLIVLTVFLVLAYYAIGLEGYFARDKSHLTREKIYVKNVLIVTAHPGDECLFFGPTICRLRREGCKIYMLCLATEGWPNLRAMKEELYESCCLLGIRRSNITLLRCTALPNNGGPMWNASFLAPLLSRFIDTYSINEVYTFDHAGVDNHPNHSSIFFAFARLVLKNRIGVPVFFLESVNRFRKWSFVFDAGLSWASYDRHWISDLFITTWEDSKRIKRALMKYASKWSGNRKIHADLNRYMYINTYRLMTRDDIHLVLQMTDYQYYIA